MWAAGVIVAGVLSLGLVEAQDEQEWVMPRTPEGYPDLQGNWSNATITPIQPVSYTHLRAHET